MPLVLKLDVRCRVWTSVWYRKYGRSKHVGENRNTGYKEILLENRFPTPCVCDGNMTGRDIV